MDIGVVREKLETVLKNLDDEIQTTEYINNYVDLLQEHGVTEDTIDIIIRTVDIDDGCNIIDELCSLDKKRLDDIWKTLVNGISEYTAIEAVKLICRITGAGFRQEIQLKDKEAGFIRAFVKVMRGRKEGATLIAETLLPELEQIKKYPEWDKLMLSLENEHIFCESMVKAYEVYEQGQKGCYSEFRRWIESGCDDISKKEIEANERLEEKKTKDKEEKAQIESLMIEIVQLKEKVADYSKSNNVLNAENSKLEKELRKCKELAEKQNGQLQWMTGEIETLNKKNEEYVQLSQIQKKHIDEAKIALLKDIANALKAEHKDYLGTLEYESGLELVEFYREQIQTIFNILTQKGVIIE